MQLFLLLGANLGNRFETLDRAKTLLMESVGHLTGESRLYETAPWGVTGQPPYLNQVLQLQTELTPIDALNQTQAIENTLGRVRVELWGSRLIDIDLLYYDNLILQTDRLILPHPRLHLRRFTLAPLCDVDPDFVHPILGKTNAELLSDCDDAAFVGMPDTHAG